MVYGVVYGLLRDAVEGETKLRLHLFVLVPFAGYVELDFDAELPRHPVAELRQRMAQAEVEPRRRQVVAELAQLLDPYHSHVLSAGEARDNSRIVLQIRLEQAETLHERRRVLKRAVVDFARYPFALVLLHLDYIRYVVALQFFLFNRRLREKREGRAQLAQFGRRPRRVGRRHVASEGEREYLAVEPSQRQDYLVVKQEYRKQRKSRKSRHDEGPQRHEQHHRAEKHLPRDRAYYVNTFVRYVVAHASVI